LHKSAGGIRQVERARFLGGREVQGVAATRFGEDLPS
jgi:hypothetical protein